VSCDERIFLAKTSASIYVKWWAISTERLRARSLQCVTQTNLFWSLRCD